MTTTRSSPTGSVIPWSWRPTTVATPSRTGHLRPQARRWPAASALGPLWRQRRLAGPVRDGLQPGPLDRSAGRGRGAHEHQDAAGALPGAARPACGVGPPAHPAPVALVAVAVALGVRLGPAALHPPPDLTDPARRRLQGAPAARMGSRAAACPDTARTHGDANRAPRAPLTALLDASHSPFPARLGVQHARDHRSQSARRWNRGKYGSHAVLRETPAAVRFLSCEPLLDPLS